MAKQKLFRVERDTGLAFSAVAELLQVDEVELLQNLMKSYVQGIQEKVVEIGVKYPAFAEKYPFVE